jgi:flagellar biogenesis protein FliO
VPRATGKRLFCTCAALVGAAASWGAFAQELEGLRGLTRPEDAVGMPSLGRVVLVLLLMVAIAIAAVYVIRRWQPKLEAHFTASRSIKVLERSVVGGARLYLLQVDDQRVLLTQLRGRVATLLLPPAAHQQDSQAE